METIEEREELLFKILSSISQCQIVESIYIYIYVCVRVWKRGLFLLFDIMVDDGRLLVSKKYFMARVLDEVQLDVI